MPYTAEKKRIDLSLEKSFYDKLKVIANEEKRSVPNTALYLMEEGVKHRQERHSTSDDIPSSSLANLAEKGGSFDWLADEPDLYDDTCGEPI